MVCIFSYFDLTKNEQLRTSKKSEKVKKKKDLFIDKPGRLGFITSINRNYYCKNFRIREAKIIFTMQTFKNAAFILLQFELFGLFFFSVKLYLLIVFSGFERVKLFSCLWSSLFILIAWLSNGFFLITFSFTTLVGWYLCLARVKTSTFFGIVSASIIRLKIFSFSLILIILSLIAKLLKTVRW